MDYLLSRLAKPFHISLLLLTLVGCTRPGGNASLPVPPDDSYGAGISSGEVLVVEPMFPETEPESGPLSGDLSKNEPLLPKADRQISMYAVPVERSSAKTDAKLPKVSDLEPQIEDYVKSIKKNLDDLDGSVRFADDADVLHRDANTLVLIALALGVSDEENKYKKSAPAIIAAARKIETVITFDAAEKAVAELEKSLTASPAQVELKWEKVASLKPLMKAVPYINNVVKRNLRNEAALKKGAPKVVQGTAVLAVIGQGSVPNADETTKPASADQWKKLCFDFRDAALDVNEKTGAYIEGKATFDDVDAAFETLSETCNTCHEVFFHEVK